MKALHIAILLPMLPAALCAQEPNGCNMGWANDPRVDPRNEYVICLPEIGEMNGVGSHYGDRIHALADLNHDGLRDWAIAHTVDTLFVKPNGYLEGPYELLIYRGERGHLPNPFSFERVGPSELASVSWLVSYGDWDNSGSVDLAVAHRLIGDTSAGNVGADYNIARFVVFWADSSGRYSISDTTRLENGCERWFGPRGTFLSLDVNRDHIDDLITIQQSGFSNGAVVKLPRMLVWYGHDREQWGRDGVGRMFDWSWWNSPDFDKVIDHDGDGLFDLTGQTAGSRATAYVLYGGSTGVLDTSLLVSVQLNEAAHSGTSVFSDLTGDRVPELVALSGGSGENTIKVYIGLRGQRLAEQFGSGADSAHPGQERWWGRPWAEVWQPYRINDYWTRNDALYDLGDADLDGIDDVWSNSYPFLIEYNSAVRLDSLIDAMVRNPGTDDYLKAHANLGDIDGSGIPTLAIASGYSTSKVRFYQMSRELQSFPYKYRLLPPGTGPAGLRDVPPTGSQLEIRLQARPNPARDEVEFTWDSPRLTGRAAISFVTADGRKIAAVDVFASAGRCVIDVHDLPRGTWLVTLRTSSGVASTMVALP